MHCITMATGVELTAQDGLYNNASGLWTLSFFLADDAVRLEHLQSFFSDVCIFLPKMSFHSVMPPFPVAICALLMMS